MADRSYKPLHQLLAYLKQEWGRNTARDPRREQRAPDHALLVEFYTICSLIPIEIQLMALEARVIRLGSSNHRHRVIVQRQLRRLAKKLDSDLSPLDEDLGNLYEAEHFYDLQNRGYAEFLWRQMRGSDPFPEELWAKLKKSKYPSKRALLFVAAATEREPGLIKQSIKRARRKEPKPPKWMRR